MGAIKEFYHDEICAGMEDLDNIDDSYWEAKWQENAALDALNQMEKEEKEIKNSGVPKHFHSKF